MRRYKLAAVAAVTLAFAPMATAVAASGSGSGGSSTNTTQVFSICDISQPCSAGAAGTVMVVRSGRTVSIVSVSANPGWRHRVTAASGLSAEVEFRNGTARIDFQAEVEDGVVRVRVRTR